MIIQAEGPDTIFGEKVKVKTGERGGYFTININNQSEWPHLNIHKARKLIGELQDYVDKGEHRNVITTKTLDYVNKSNKEI